jgi:hypothetical protein
LRGNLLQPVALRASPWPATRWLGQHTPDSVAGDADARVRPRQRGPGLASFALLGTNST